jgi:hypothetical protein
MNKIYTNEQLLVELQKITDLIGRAPSYEEVRKNSNIAPRTFQRHLGKTWEDVKRCVGWKSQYELFNPQNISEKDGAWLSGIIDGEGCIRIQRPSPNSGNGLSKSYAPVFSISLRYDDKPMMDEVCRIIGTKCHIHKSEESCPSHKNMRNASPSCAISVRDLPTIAYHLIPILEKYPLRSKKKFELPLFKKAANILLNKRTSNRMNRQYTDEERQLLDSLYHALSDFKKYNANREEILKKYNLPIILLDY